MATSIAEEIDSLRDQLEGLQTSISRNMTEDVSLVAGLKEWSGALKEELYENILRKLKLSRKLAIERNRT
jgi:hypothetical protein